MKKLISTSEISREEWLKYRKNGITGTDAGAICGLNPFVSAFQVYQDKISEEFEDYDNESMRQGRDLEAYVAKRFTEKTGLKVRRANAIYQNEDYPFMLADFDRLIVGEKSGLECKTVSPYSAEKWADGKIPLHYLMQVQHYLGVSGFDCWYVAALILGREFIIRKIERDEEIINYLIMIEENFWKNNVLARVMPDPDGSENCSKAIAKEYFRCEEDKIIELHGYKTALDRRFELEELMNKMKKEIAEIDQKIKMEMQDASIALESDYKVFWSSFEQTRLDTRKLKEERPEIYEEYCKKNIGRRFTVKHVA